MFAEMLVLTLIFSIYDDLTPDALAELEARVRQPPESFSNDVLFFIVC
jgi:hypothetical protein